MSSSAETYLDGLATVRSVIELDEEVATEVLETLIPKRERDPDPTLAPWKRGCQAAIRAAVEM